jgi:hypothetical protein
MTDSLTHCMDSGTEMSQPCSSTMKFGGLPWWGCYAANRGWYSVSTPASYPVSDQVRHLTHSSCGRVHTPEWYANQKNVMLGITQNLLHAAACLSCADRRRILLQTRLPITQPPKFPTASASLSIEPTILFTKTMMYRLYSRQE